MTPADLLVGLGLFCLGFLVAWLLGRIRIASLQTSHQEQLRRAASLETDIAALRTAHTSAREENAALREQSRHSTLQLEQVSREKSQLAASLTSQFQEIASRLFDEKSQRLSELNKQQVGAELSPLLAKVEEFRSRVDQIHTEETRERASLRTEVAKLFDFSQQLGAEAKRLTNALTSTSSIRGKWGELILERTLELSGLERGREYELQVAHDGARLDAVIFLPDQRYIIIDSKVPLLAYETAMNAADSTARESALAEHSRAILGFIQNLSAKNYPRLYEDRTPDFTILFIPIESALAVALHSDSLLLEKAFQHHIVLCTPTTLLAALRTIANVWRIERQNKNVQKIAALGGQIHDEFARFLDDMHAIGTSLHKATEAHRHALFGLTEKRGNLLSRARQLRDLGTKTAKTLPTPEADNSTDSPETLP
jgi:DNA recombination protein RmuC